MASSYRIKTFGASLLWLTLTSPALGHGPAPAPLELLHGSGPSDAFTPSLIRLNIGLARATEGSWVYGCPSQFGDSETARMASTSDGALLAAVGGGEAYASQDGGCSFERVDRAEGSPFYALGASSDGDGVWLLAGNVGDSEGALSRLSASGEMETTRLFTGGEGWIPDSLVPWSLGERSGVLVAGASPQPAVWRGERLVTAAGTHWTWTSWPISGLDQSTSFMRLSGIDDAARFWLVVTDQEGRNLWRGTFTPDWPPVLAIAHAPVKTLKGPVVLGGRTLALMDGQLKSATASESPVSWLPLGPVGWTCLDQVGGAVVGCSLTQLERLLDDGTEGVPATETLFLLADLQAPVTACMDEDSEEQCFGDWVHFGVEAGLYDPGDPLTSAPETSSDSRGCAASPLGEPVGLGLLGIAWLAWSRRRRAC